MYRLINIIFLACLISVEARPNFPITLDAHPRDDIKAKITYQLPTTVTPKNYQITLSPYFVGKDPEKKNFTFIGEVTIALDVLTDVDSITLHSSNLTYSSKTIKLTKGDTQPISVQLKDETEEERAFNSERDFKVIVTSDGKKIPKGSYHLTINYDGILHDDMRGFYRSSYKNDKQETV